MVGDGADILVLRPPGEDLVADDEDRGGHNVGLQGFSPRVGQVTLSLQPFPGARKDGLMIGAPKPGAVAVAPSAREP